MLKRYGLYTPVGHETPVFHGTSGKIRDGYHILFLQRELLVEIFFVILQNQRTGVLGKVRLFDRVLSGHYSELDFVVSAVRFNVGHLGYHVSHQVSRHRNGFFELVENVVRIRWPEYKNGTERCYGNS